jgi:hypothetical protein
VACRVYLQDLQRYRHVFLLSLGNNRLQERCPDALPLVLGKELDTGEVKLALAAFDGNCPNILVVLVDNAHSRGVESASEALPLVGIISSPDERHVGSQRSDVQVEEELEVGLGVRSQRVLHLRLPTGSIDCEHDLPARMLVRRLLEITGW